MSAQQLFHGSGEIHGPETGKNAGDDAGGGKGGGIHQHGARAGAPAGHGPLPGVVRCDCSTILSRIKDIKGLRL